MPAGVPRRIQQRADNYPASLPASAAKRMLRQTKAGTRAPPGACFCVWSLLMAGMTSLTGIGRLLQPQLRSHRIVLAGAALAGVLYALVALVTERNPADAVLVALAVFVAWATGRELDPDRTRVAVLAMPIALVASFYSLPSVLAAAVAMIAIRLVAGTIGAAITPVDIVGLVFIGFVSGSTPVLWIVALAIAMWLLTSAEAGRLKFLGLVSLAGGTALGVVRAEIQDVAITQDAYLLAAFGGAVMLLAMSPKTIMSQNDARTGIVDPGRVTLARKAAGSFLMWAAVMGGVAGFWTISPILAALAATAAVKWFLPGA